MTGDKLAKILAEEAPDGAPYTERDVLDAMRRAYLMGRDDANADADDAENESIERMEDDDLPTAEDIRGIFNPEQ